MKRLIAVMCAFLVLVGCSGAPASSATPPPQSATPPQSTAASPVSSVAPPDSAASSESAAPSSSSEVVSTIASTSSSNSKDESVPPLDIKDIVVKINDIAPPDSAGNVHMTACYSNNSSVIIKDISIKVLFKDSNDTAYLSCSDTVLPGETSPNFESFGPKSLLKDDVIFLSCDITILNQDKSETWVSYDNKTGQMEWYVV